MSGPLLRRKVHDAIYARLRRSFDLPGPDEVSPESLYAGDPVARDAWLRVLRHWWGRGGVSKVKNRR